MNLPSSVASDLRALAPSRWERWTAGPRRLLDLLRDPPDLVERAIAVEFIIAVYPDYTARITATKLSGASVTEVQHIANAGIAAVLTWAKQQGAPLELKGPAKK